jgi:SAM-dependent methyltransferase
VSERARSFETVAAEYERHRPDYPEEALRWAAEALGLEPVARVLDVGAGTGKLTRGLVSLGFDVVAAEPGGGMLEQLRIAVPEAETYEAPAEALPLPDASVDAAFAAQAYHWFERERALPELHRVVRPGGGLVLVWNWWDERDPLQHELAPVIGYSGHQPGCREHRGVEPGRARRLPVHREQVPHRAAEGAGGVPPLRARGRVAVRRELLARAPDLLLRLRAHQLTRGSSGMRATSS